MQCIDKFSVEIFLKIGIENNLYDQNYILGHSCTHILETFVDDMHNKGFKPYNDALVRSRHKKGHNYSLVFLAELLEFNGLKIIAQSKNNFRYNYSDKSVADEFNIERNILLYLKKKYMVSYQILCDCYSYRALNIKTKFIEKKELEVNNESQKILFPFVSAIYSNGSSFLGFSSLAQTLNKAGYSGYKTYCSINRAFSSNSAKVRYINEIVSAYNLRFDTVDKNSKCSSKKIKEEISSKTFEKFYDKNIEDIKGLRIKSLNLRDSDIFTIISEALAFRMQNIHQEI